MFLKERWNSTLFQPSLLEGAHSCWKRYQGLSNKNLTVLWAGDVQANLFSIHLKNSRISTRYSFDDCIWRQIFMRTDSSVRKRFCQTCYSNFWGGARLEEAQRARWYWVSLDPTTDLVTFGRPPLQNESTYLSLRTPLGQFEQPVLRSCLHLCAGISSLRFIIFHCVESFKNRQGCSEEHG